MAQVRPVYVVHPTDDITAEELATLYGLAAEDYITGPLPANTWHKYIHLYVREDGKYQNIKTELGDVDGTAFYDDLIVERQVTQLRRRRYE